MESYSNFVKKYHRLIIVLWLSITLILAPIAPKINEIIVYQVEVSLPNSEFQKTVDKLNQEFANKTYAEPYLNVLASFNYYIIIKSDNPYSTKVKEIDYYIRDKFENLTNKFTLSYYKLIELILINILKNYTEQINILYNDTYTVYNKSKEIKELLMYLENKYLEVYSKINQTLMFIYGPPLAFLLTYSSLNIKNPFLRAEIAKNLTIANLKLSGITLEYFNAVYKEWLKVHSADYANSMTISIRHVAPYFLGKYFNVPDYVITLILGYSNISNWNNKNTISNITLQIIQYDLPVNIIGREQILIELNKIITKGENIDNVTYNILFNNISSYSNNTELLNDILKSIINLDYFNETIVKSIISNKLSDIIIKNLNYNPYFIIKKENMINFLESIIGNKDINTIIKNYIANEEISKYPIDLKDNIKASFIDEKDGIFLIAVFSNHYPRDEENEHDLKIFNEIKNDLNNKDVIIYITGVSLLSHELKIGAENALSIVIPLGLLVVFIIVSIYFRSIIAGFLVLALFAISITITLAIGYIILGEILGRKISFISPSIVVVLTLGLCSDYVVYLLRRYKIERDEGKDYREAIKMTTFWSARGVITSALAVLFSYIILSLMNIPLFGDTAIANTIGVASTMITCLLFFPSILYVMKDKTIWPYKKSLREIKLSKIYELNVRRKKEITIILSSLTLISLIFVANINTVLDVPPLMPPSDVQKGALLLYSTIGSTMSPVYIYVEGKGKVLIDDKINSTYLNYISEIVSSISNIKDIKYIYTIDRPLGEKIDLNKIYQNETIKNQFLPQIERFIGLSNKGILIEVIIDKQPFSLQAIEVLKEIRAHIPKNEEFSVYVDGVTQLSYDSKLVTDSSTPTIITSLIIVIIILLFLQLISILIPFRLVLTILSSIAWSLALLYLVYNLAFNLPLINAVPIFLAVTMLGVGVDYDIFLMTKVREEVVKGKSDEEAIRIALEKVGTTIIVLGLLLGSTFLLLMVPRFPLLNEIGFAIGLSVLFDSFVIVQFFVPSITLIAKKWNWWPSKLSR
jgi:RND superfamily putative drug exporter